MKAAIICFTGNGLRTAVRAARALDGYSPRIWIKKKDCSGMEEGAVIWEGSLEEWTRQRFEDSALIVFTGAAGIAVRAIAPHLKGKTVDPAVLCVDEKASFVIPLVSGHIGGANEYAAMLADRLGAQAVITTATDINNKFAVDVFARKNALRISDMGIAKRVSSAILDGAKIPFESEFPLAGKMPPCLIAGEKAASDTPATDILASDSPSPEVFVGIHERPKYLSGQDDKDLLRLIPAVISVGAGCRKGTDPAELEAFLKQTLLMEGLREEAVEQICSIDIKENEPAIKALSRSFNVPLKTFTAGELNEAEGDFNASDFVRSVTGTDNVCERSAVLGSAQGTLIVRKRAYNGMTLALAAREWRGSFE